MEPKSNFGKVDPKTMYLVNSEVYLGKQTPGGDKGLGEQVSNFSDNFL